MDGKFIHADFHAIIGQVRENGQDNPLKSGWGIEKSKREHPIIIDTPWVGESGLLLVFKVLFVFGYNH
jgi:hypothetical protein